MRCKAHPFCVVHGVVATTLCGCLCLSCSGKEEAQEPPLPQRTVLVYMAADNDLYRNAA
jgi:hypothetical protein